MLDTKVLYLTVIAERCLSKVNPGYFLFIYSLFCCIKCRMKRKKNIFLLLRFPHACQGIYIHIVLDGPVSSIRAIITTYLNNTPGSGFRKLDLPTHTSLVREQFLDQSGGTKLALHLLRCKPLIICSVIYILIFIPCVCLEYAKFQDGYSNWF